MKHPLSAVSRLHNQQKLQSELEFQIEEGKQFNRFRPPLRQGLKPVIGVKRVEVIKN
jgi:hypothetical protein